DGAESRQGGADVRAPAAGRTSTAERPHQTVGAGQARLWRGAEPRRQAASSLLTMTLDGDYDYIVVGAGSAGCVVANRLSADPKNRVLLLEAGGSDNWIWFHIPVGYLFAIGNPRSDWMFRTEPEAGLNGRSLAYPRGKVIGGSSAINAMISMRGQAADYDHWRQLGLGGGWRIEAPRLSWAVLDAVGGAAEEIGIRKIADFNTGDNEGVGYFH